MSYFNHIKKAVKKLDRANIESDKIELICQALYTFKEMSPLVRARGAEMNPR